jgi:hypothetical protein
MGPAAKRRDTNQACPWQGDLSWLSEFCGKPTGCKSTSHTNEDAANHETGEGSVCWREGLQKRGNHGDHAANANAISTAKVIGLYARNQRHLFFISRHCSVCAETYGRAAQEPSSDNSAYSVDGVNEANHVRVGIAHGRLPVLRSLHRVEDARVVAQENHAPCRHESRVPGNAHSAPLESLSLEERSLGTKRRTRRRTRRLVGHRWSRTTYQLYQACLGGPIVGRRRRIQDRQLCWWRDEM